MSSHKHAAPTPIAAGSHPAPDAWIARALSRPPQVSIPADFARRVARQATAQPGRRASRLPGWGPRLALASGVLLTVAMFALAPHVTASLSSFAFDAELLLITELGALALFANRLHSQD